MKPLLILALLLAAACSASTAPRDQDRCSGHTWTTRTDLNHHPLTYFWCEAGQHEPLSACQISDAEYWYSHH